MNIRLQDRFSVNEIRKQAKQQGPIENVIRKRHLTWFGHVCITRDEKSEKRMMKEDSYKKRNKGKSHKRWLDLINEDTGMSVAIM